jgi:hypothetical protein
MAPNLVSIAPDEGAVAGGEAVTLTGTGFPTDVAAVVTFDGVPATDVVVVDATTITCLTPAGATGAVDVVVTFTLSGESVADTLVDGFAYVLTEEVELPVGGIGLTWVERTDRADNVHVSAKVDLADAADYYHGFKAARVVTWGAITRALSDRDGQFEGADFSWTEHDTDRAIRGQLAADSTKYFVNRPAVLRMIDDASRRLELMPRTIVRGLISSYKPLSPLQFSFAATDLLTRRFASSTQNPVLIPQRTITAADFPNAPAEAIGLAVPILYGQVSDKTELTTIIPGTPGPAGGGYLSAPTNVQAVVVGGGGGATRRYAVTACNNQFGQQAPSDHRGETNAVYVEVAGAPNEGGPSNHVKITCDHVPGAVHYRIYGRYVDLVKLLDLMDLGWGLTRPTYYDGMRPYGAPELDILKMDGDPPSVNNTGDGPGTPESSVTTDTGAGVVPVIYVGQRTLGDGNAWHEFLICGHAITAIESWYVGGVRQWSATEAVAPGPWLMPGHPGYTAAVGAATYRDYNARRYAVCYGLVGVTEPDAAAAGTTRLTLNVQGIETIGDGTGVLIQDLHQQYKHLVTNWILQSYQAGAWLATPTFDDDATVTQLAEASFDAASATAAERLTGDVVDVATVTPAFALGYRGGGILGANGEHPTVRDVIARLNISGDVDSGFNRHGQFIVAMVSESLATQAAAIALDDVSDVFADTFEILDDLSAHFNQMPYSYARDYPGTHDSGWIGSGTLEDAVSIDNYGGDPFRAPDLLLEWVRHQATAEDVVGRRLLRMKDPPRIATFTIGLSGMNYDLGEVLTLTHFQGVGAAGWSGQPLRIVRHQADPDQGTVTLEALDLKQLFEATFILGDETALPADWTAATAANRVYGYLADEDTERFSDGAKGKRLR